MGVKYLYGIDVTGQSTFSTNVGIGTLSPGAKLDVAGGSIQLSTSGSGVYFGPSSSAQIIGVSGASSYLALGTVGTERVRITSAGNVGIGTTSPGTDKLKIQTDGTAINGLNIYSPSVSNGAKITLSDNIYSGFIKTIPSNALGETQLVLGAGSVDAINIKQNGNVGIGTTAPATLLHVYSNTGAINPAIRVQSGASAGFPLVQLTDSRTGGQTWNIENGRTTAGTLGFYKSGTGSTGTLAVIDTAGNVGIGTTSPAYKLDVAGEVRTSSNFIADNATLGSLSLRISGTETGRLDNYNSALRLINFHASSATVISGNGDISIGSLGSSTIKFSTSNAEKMRINSAGNVGIGTTSPGAKLTVKSPGEVGSYGDGFVLERNGTSAKLIRMYESSADGYLEVRTGADGIVSKISGYSGTPSYFLSNVGIGTTAPNTLLDVIGQISLYDYINIQNNYPNFTQLSGIRGKAYYQTNQPTSILMGDPGASNNNIIVFNVSDGDVTGTEKMRIQGNGNVGIGTTSPTYALDVVSNATNNSARFRNSAGGDTLVRIIAGDYNTEIDARLFIGEDDSYGMTFEYDGSANIGYIGMNDNVDPTGAFSKRIQMSRGGTEVAFMAGNVGIGTTAPAAKLDVNGNVSLGGSTTSFLESRYNTTSQYSSRLAFNGLQLGNNGENRIIAGRTSVGSPLAFYVNNTNDGLQNTPDGILALTLANTGNATFAGNVTVTGTSSTFNTGNSGTFVTNDSSNYPRITTASSSAQLGLFRSATSVGGMYIGADSIGFRLMNASFGSKFTVSQAGNAVFSGTVTAPTFLGDLNGTINTVTTAVTKANATNDTTVATTAFVQNLIGTIPAGLVFQGTWNAATNTPTLTSGTGTTGNFYIVSVDGSTNLDGITDWKVGDWAVFVEQGASDQWEKVDNSSVLDGAGTGQTVALWSGSGTSNTLTDAPITVSGNNVKIASTGDTTLILESANPGSPGIDFYEGTSEKAHITFDTVNNVLTMGRAGGDLSIDNSGNVGIGTTSPGSILHINSADPILLIKDSETSQTLANARLRLAESGAAGALGGYWDVGAIANGATFDFHINDDAGERLTILKASGNVGIGVTDPEKKLEVKSDTTYDGILIDVLSNPEINFRDRGNSDTLIGTGRHGLDGFHIDTYTGNAFFIKGSNRNVGIGTTSPGTKLDVNGNIRFTDNALSANRNNVWIGQTNLGTEDPLTSSDYFFGINPRMGAERLLSIEARTADGPGAIVFKTGSGAYSTGAPERMRITSGGNVGIGTTAPVQKLDISQGSLFLSGAGSKYLYIRRYDGLGTHSLGVGSDEKLILSLSGSNPFIIDGGNVGIGTTSPSNKLHVEGRIEGDNFVLGGSDSTVFYGLYRAGVETREVRLVSYAATPSSKVQLGFNDISGSTYTFAPALTAMYNGNVGIGTTVPSSKLDVDSGTTLTYNPAANQPTAIIANRNTSNTNNEVATLGLHITGWKGLTTAVINLNAIQSNGNSSTADFSIQTRNNGTYDEKFRITAAGNVGIGTTDPATHKLIVSGGSSLASFRSEGSGQNLKKLSISTGGDRVVLDASTTADATTAFAFQTGGSERMRIDSSGNVGIGTTSPLVKLQVSDTAAGYVSTIENLGTGADKSGLWVKTDSSWTNAIILKLTGSPSDVSIMEVNNATVRIGGGTLTVNDAKLHVVGDINIINANLSNQENLDVDTGTEVVSIVPIATYTAAFFDFVVKNGTNVRSGTVYACHDGTSVEYTETSTADLGNTSAVVFTVDISAGNMRLLATTTTDNWSVKTLTKTI